VIDKNRGFVEKHRLKFEVLRDAGNEVAAAYGLRWSFPDDLKALYVKFGIDLPAGNGEDSWTLPLPARYIIDRNGVIRYARTDPDYTRRPEPEETAEALESL
jgi:peroxiredoxin